MRRFLFLLACLLVSTSAWAHKPSDSYLSLTIHDNAVGGRWDIALRDLNDAIGLDGDHDGAITWGEVRAKQYEIDAYALSRLILTADGQACPSQPSSHLIDAHTDGAYAVLQFTALCSRPIETLQADYRLLFDVDAQHKGLLRLTHGTQTMTAIFSQEAPTQQFAMGDGSIWIQLRQYLREGVWHIWLGYDHVLFLLALLLPAVLRRVEGRWEPAPDFLSAFWEFLAIVTAFTIAHSITLGVATVGLIALPCRRGCVHHHRRPALSSLPESR